METSKKKGRSPQYPFVALGKAIERVRQLKQAEGFHPVPMGSAAKAWGFNIKSSAGLQTIAAVKAFGLIDDEGSGDKRQIRVSALGRRILLDERQESPELRRAIQESCLKPVIHRELWEKYGVDLPSTETISYYLTVGRTEQGKAPYEEEAARKVVRIYRESIIFAALSERDKVEPDEEVSVKASNDNPAHDSAVQRRAQQPVRTPSIEGTSMKQDVFSLDEGDVVLTWPSTLSRESFADLKAWLAVVERKINRTVAAAHVLPSASVQGSDADEESEPT